jgi:pentatricopeptide repeat protein
MAAQGLSPGLESYTILIDALLELPDPGSAARLFEQLLQQGLQPDGVLLTCLMKLHLASGQPLAAVKAFNQISGSPGAAVDLPAWCALVDALAVSGRMADAEQAAERAADYAAAHALPVQSCQAAYGALVKGYFWERRLQPALRAFRRFLQLGGKPHAAMCGQVAQLCAAAGDVRTARQVIRATELVGVPVDRERLEAQMRRHQQRRERQQQRRPGPGGDVGPQDSGDGLERWKWWLGLPNKYYSASDDWRA